MVNIIKLPNINLHKHSKYISERERRKILFEFDGLLNQSLSKNKPNEGAWQSFFNNNPYIFTDTIPLEFDSLYSQVRLTTGTADYIFHKTADPPLFSTTGLIEIKRPDQTIIDIYGSHIGLAKNASRAFTQLKNYFQDMREGLLLTNKGTLAIGNHRCAFIIIGMTEELIKKLYNEFLILRFQNLLPNGFQILTYDYLFEKFKSKTIFPIYFLLSNQKDVQVNKEIINFIDEINKNSRWDPGNEWTLGDDRLKSYRLSFSVKENFGAFSDEISVDKLEGPWRTTRHTYFINIRDFISLVESLYEKGKIFIETIGVHSHYIARGDDSFKYRTYEPYEEMSVQDGMLKAEFNINSA